MLQLREPCRRSDTPTVRAPRRSDYFCLVRRSTDGGLLFGVHGGRNGDAMRPAQGLEPHTPGVVEVAGQHANSFPRYSGNWSFPDRRRDMADEKDSDPMIGPSGRQDGFSEFMTGGHLLSPLTFCADTFR